MHITACKLLINGVVQGVGFRPTVYKVATALNLSGWVRNTSLGVEVVLNTTDSTHFIQELERVLPALASLDSVESSLIKLETMLSDFKILASVAGSVNDTVMSPDSYVCQDCLAEIFDPKSKYYLYPFTNCTNCGPRYTVIKGLPYDRNLTALADFPLCKSCNTEYRDPQNRRYHAQATACPKCGPSLELELAKVVEYIHAGKIVALKGVGGYVLLADATNSATVRRLRERKGRAEKPFAVMALNTNSIQHNFAHVSPHEAGVLESPAAPIVILGRKRNAHMAAEVAPKLNTLGMVLPNSPLYYILFYHLLGAPIGTEWLQQNAALALIVTSANFSGGAIISDNDEARKQLTKIADYVVSADRDIVMKSDDSVISCVGQHNVILRRARGIAPKPFYFPYQLPQVLALGAHLKNTLTFTRNNKAFTSQYLGDMSSEHTIRYFKQVLTHYHKVFNFKSELVITDLHPDFYVRNFARELGLPQLQLQHHFAHLASVIANAESCGKKIANKVLGCILDGYGYGLDGSSWGGELIQFSSQDLGFELISQLTPLQIPGGDIAENEPWRIALALCVENNLVIPEHLLVHPQAAQVIELCKRQQFGTSTSLGRKFSAVAALLNIITESKYEAHAAMVMESIVHGPEVDFDYARLNLAGVPDFNLLIKQVYQIGIIEKNVQRAVNLFYGNLSVLIEKWILFHCSTRGISQVAISGGCWQSRYLLSALSDKFKLLGIELLIPYQLPFNDECISFGQAWYGAQALQKGILCV